MPSDEPPVYKKGLASKITHSVVGAVFSGVALILLIQVTMTLAAVPGWGGGAKEAMIELELENILKLASDKAAFITGIFERVDEGILQVQALAEQALLVVPETMVVDHPLMGYSGLQQSDSTWDHSVWFIPGYDVEDNLATGSSHEDLVHRSSLMDIGFRGMQRQHSLIYLASLDEPSPEAGIVSDINMQAYAAFDMEEAGFQQFSGEDCDNRFTEYVNGYNPIGYDPRCRAWYQDASASGRSEAIFTKPYSDAGSGKLTITVAGPVYDSADPTLLLGVAGIDMDITDIENSVNNLAVIGDKGLAYLLAPGTTGEVAVHHDLNSVAGTQYIIDLESGVDEEEYRGILARMRQECIGSETYSNGGDTWLMSWAHETASSVSVGSGGVDCAAGYIVVVTVGESSLLEVFSRTESEIRQIVALASAVMVAILIEIFRWTHWFARALSKGITEPVDQLVDVLQTLNQMDFSKQAAGTWMVNDVTSPEVEELMAAFEAMTTVVKFANMSLGSGDIDLAQYTYCEAKALFTKLGNDRGVGIINNNLGSVYTLQARQLSAEAATRKDITKANELWRKADGKYADAAASFQLAIDDAFMQCTEENQRLENDCNASQPLDQDCAGMYSRADDRSSALALSLQLANRKFNLALCLAAKGNNTVQAGGYPDLNAINEARRLMYECARLAASRGDAKGDQRQVECLLELAKVERDQPGRQREATEALDSAERVINGYRGSGEGGGGAGGIMSSPPGGLTLPTPLAILRQQLLAARGAHCVVVGFPETAIDHWTHTIISCGDRMDVGAVRASLVGLREQVENGNGARFPGPLLVVLGMPPSALGAYALDPQALVAALDKAIAKVDFEAAKHGIGLRDASSTTEVDLCFVMDCTRSMQSWIDQAKNKLIEIIEQAKRDIANLQLRVSFVGYRDFGDKTQYEGPYDFHTEEDMPKLLGKLKDIQASGGLDVPEDVAGGLKRATELSWKSPIRVCILIADAPCHGSVHHRCRDNYPNGCPKGLNPSKLIYTLQYELGVDFYFVRITSITDRMISIFQDTLKSYLTTAQHANRPALIGTKNTEPKFMVHDLGSDNNRFLEAVVQSVKVSAGINLRVETY